MSVLSSILVVGSGASSIHLAKTLVDADINVTMLDVGHEKPNAVRPDDTFDDLKENLDDPVGYFLGANGDSVVLPQDKSKFYSFPPSKEYVFRQPNLFRERSTGFEPVISFARGGLAEAWTGGVYPLNNAELVKFPFDLSEISPCYEEVIRRIGVSAARDDLEKFSAWYESYQDPIQADKHTQYLLERYAKKRNKLNSGSGFYFGRSRISALSKDHAERHGCDQLGRCLYGCPRQSIYAPSYTLQELRGKENFNYIDDAFVTHFTCEGSIVTGFTAADRQGRERVFTADRYVLGAGTLCSSKVFLDSLYRHTGRREVLTGLMDNQQCVMPFFSPGMIARKVNNASYQFQSLAFGIEQEKPEEYVHGQITTLKAAAIHPIVQNLPFDTRTSLRVFRVMHAALAVANFWLHDRRRDGNYVTIEPGSSGELSVLQINYQGEDSRLCEVATSVRRSLALLGAVAPKGMTQFLPSGSSVHYAGTIPMQIEKQPLTCSPKCRSHDFDNLYFADGVSFPFLPAKNLTFTLMANAIRVAEGIIEDAS